MEVCRKVAVTGHRPQFLKWGSDYRKTHWKTLKNYFKSILKEIKCEDAYTGMAIGVDTVFAMAVIELQREGYPIKLHCVLPCYGQENKWDKKSQELYRFILSRADEILVSGNGKYSSECMQDRNETLVDMTDMLIAIWNGNNSGTLNCIRYACRQGKPITVVSPKMIEELQKRRK